MDSFQRVRGVQGKGKGTENQRRIVGGALGRGGTTVRMCSLFGRVGNGHRHGLGDGDMVVTTTVIVDCGL